MEINQKLFDECTQNYKQQRAHEKQSLSKRENMWSKLDELAAANPQYSHIPHTDDEFSGGSSNAVPGSSEEGADINDIMNYERKEHQINEQVCISYLSVDWLNGVGNNVNDDLNLFVLYHIASKAKECRETIVKT